MDDGGGEVDSEVNNGTVVADDVEFISNPGIQITRSHTFTKTSTQKSDKSSKSTLTHKRSTKSLKSYSLKTWYRAIGKSKWSSPLTTLYLTINKGKKKEGEVCSSSSSSSGSDEDERGAGYCGGSARERRSSTSHYSDDENKVTINVCGEDGGGSSPGGSDKSIVFVGGDGEVDRVVQGGGEVYERDFNNNKGVCSGTYKKERGSVIGVNKVNF